MVVLGHSKVQYMCIMLALGSEVLWWKEHKFGREIELGCNLAFTTYYLCDLGHIN